MIEITDEMLAQAAHEVDMAILAMFPDPDDCEHTFSASFERKMKRLIWKVNHFLAYKVLKRVAIILIALLTSASMFLAVNTEARATFFGWIKETFENAYHYFFVAEEDPKSAQDYYPTWVPAGYNLSDSFDSPNGKTYVFLNEKDEMLQFTYTQGSISASVMAGIGEYNIIEINLNGFQAEIYSSTETNFTNGISWTGDNGNILFYMSGYVNKDDLIKTAQSVMPVE